MRNAGFKHALARLGVTAAVVDRGDVGSEGAMSSCKTGPTEQETRGKLNMVVLKRDVQCSKAFACMATAYSGLAAYGS